MLCLFTATGVLLAALGMDAFTLAWTHSVERTAWQEDWRLAGGRLELVEARVQGSGAGMEPPDGAVLEDGWWRYRPDLPPLERLVLSHSPYAGDYLLCGAGACRALSEWAAPPAEADVMVVAACH